MPKYDVVILGAGMAGCAAAALLTRSGKRVLIMDPAGRPGGGSASVELKDISIPGWPLCTYGFDEGGAWNALLHELGLSGPAALQGASYQVALPGRRITVSPDSNMTLGELRREYPGEIDGLSRLYRDAHALVHRMSRSRVTAFLARRRTAGDFLRSYRFSRELLALFSASTSVFFGLPLHKTPLAQFVALVSTPPQFISEGFDRMSRGLCDIVARQGGECRLDEPWPEILVHGARLQGVQTGSERIDSHAAVLNVPSRERERMLFAVVREEVIPVGMIDTVLLVTDYDRPEETMILSLGTRIGTGLRPLQAFFPDGTGRDAASGDLSKRISELIPFLEDFTEATACRIGTDRSQPILRHDIKEPHRGASGGALFHRLPVRTLYVLDDTAFGVVRQAGAARTLADRLA